NQPTAALVAGSAGQRWRVLLEDAAGGLRWGAPAGSEIGRAAGTPLSAHVLGAAGERLGDTQLVRIPLADVDGAIYLVPEPHARGRALALPGRTPIAFTD